MIEPRVIRVEQPPTPLYLESIKEDLLGYANVFCEAEGRERPPTIMRRVQELRDLLNDNYTYSRKKPEHLDDALLLRSMLDKKYLFPRGSKSEILEKLNQLDQEVTDILETNKRIKVLMITFALIMLAIGLSGDLLQDNTTAHFKAHVVESTLLEMLPRGLEINQGTLLDNSLYAHLVKALGKNIADVILGQMSDISLTAAGPLVFSAISKVMIDSFKGKERRSLEILDQALTKKNLAASIGVFAGVLFNGLYLLNEVSSTEYAQKDPQDVLVFLIPIISIIIYMALYKSGFINNVWKNVPEAESASVEDKNQENEGYST